MIADFRPFSDVSIHLRIDQATRKCRAQEHVVDPQSGIARKGVSEIIPEG